jgi:hypothetical protein
MQAIACFPVATGIVGLFIVDILQVNCLHTSRWQAYQYRRGTIYKKSLKWLSCHREDVEKL